MAQSDRAERFSFSLRLLSSISVFVLAVCAIVLVLREPPRSGPAPSGALYVQPDRTLVGILEQLTALQDKLAKSLPVVQVSTSPAQREQAPTREAQAANVTVVVESARPEAKCCGDARLADAGAPISKSVETSLNVYTAVWYPTPDSSDDRGEVEKTIVPKLKHFIGSRMGCKIFVDGNADSVGSDRHNSALSARRAKAVSEKLSAQISKDKADVTTSSGSERNHMKITGDNADQLYNRRTDIHLTCG